MFYQFQRNLLSTYDTPENWTSSKLRTTTTVTICLKLFWSVWVTHTTMNSTGLPSFSKPPLRPAHSTPTRQTRRATQRKMTRTDELAQAADIRKTMLSNLPIRFPDKVCREFIREDSVRHKLSTRMPVRS